MRQLSNFADIPAACRGAVVAIGNFDGVHLGHVSVLDQAAGIATRTSRPRGIVTFEPHPRQFFQPEAQQFRLMTRESRARRLELLGIDVVFELPFDAGMAGTSAGEFARSILARHLAISHAVVGADFRFGKDRAGDAAALSAYGTRHGFEVTVATLVSDGDTECSSSAIRLALADKRPKEAARMLGHLHRIEGRVVHGEKRGRELGFPTANLSLCGMFVPSHGVYAVLVDIINGRHRGRFTGVASIGTRPMFDGASVNLEVYLFDFEGEIYGDLLSVALVEYLRPELRFSSVDELKARMRTDCREGRAALSALPQPGVAQ